MTTSGPPSVAGRTIAITGATGGIGQAVAQAFRARGAALVLIDTDRDRLQVARTALGGEATVLCCDQSRDRDIDALFGDMPPIDGLINNAGITVRKPLLETSHVEIQALLDINLAGAIKVAIGAAKRMIAGGRQGVILNVSSQLAFSSAFHRGIYGVSKAGLAQFTRTAALEWAPHGIRVLGIAPGTVISPMTASLLDSPADRDAILKRIPAGTFLTVEKVADMIVQLCSPTMSHVVGQTLIADGGSVLV